MTADLKRLWQEAFEDSEDDIADFFATGFSSDRFHCILENGKPISALHWFDCLLEDRKIAYLYAVATAKSHRGKGFARRLMEETHAILTKKGYAGAILVPMKENLFAFYGKLGFSPATTVSEFVCDAGTAPVSLTQIDADHYARARKTYLPANSVLQGKDAFTYLQTYAKFYEGADFLLAATVENNILSVHEFLGNTNTAPNILNALGLPQGKFRTPGADRDFAVFLKLAADCPVPAYFGLALD